MALKCGMFLNFLEICNENSISVELLNFSRLLDVEFRQNPVQKNTFHEIKSCVPYISLLILLLLFPNAYEMKTSEVSV